MPKTSSQPTSAADHEVDATSSPVAVQPKSPPTLGSTCVVQVADGLTLMNNETGVHFIGGEPTSQTVTLTLLRRLADGDLVLVA